MASQDRRNFSSAPGGFDDEETDYDPRDFYSSSSDEDTTIDDVQYVDPYRVNPYQYRPIDFTRRRNSYTYTKPSHFDITELKESETEKRYGNFIRGRIDSDPSPRVESQDKYGDLAWFNKMKLYWDGKDERKERGVSTPEDHTFLSSNWMNKYGEENQTQWPERKKKLHYSELCHVPYAQVGQHWEDTKTRMINEVGELENYKNGIIHLYDNRAKLTRKEFKKIHKLQPKKEKLGKSLQKDKYKNDPERYRELTDEFNRVAQALAISEKRLANLSEEQLMFYLNKVMNRVMKLKSAMKNGWGWMYVRETETGAQQEWENLIQTLNYSLNDS